ncbi:GNAT family acetyltransferase [Legionella beliardensis]|uniref:GNAT family acetyltransferase n=1 Tax=Legionella beliardensis TaxID=91822 RepID=A0A378JT67_9GAMM|nr:GNAT family N-acetyltransferase [Legionella beliardensis]STX55468.1 GNAT family acetyltransferase [Legionella beliardensis]STX55542.1 GNAT family acetyltransferase [Legionella beliardensis]
MTHFIETERLYIHAPTLSDIDNWQTLHSDQETMKYLGGTRDRGTTLQWLKNDIAHYKKHGFCLGSVFERESKMFIGIAGLVYLNYDDNQQDIEIGYQLKKSCWDKGYASELVQSLIKWGFFHLKVNRLVAVTRPDNHKSQRVLEKAKMQYEGKIQFHNNEEDYLFYVVYKQR